MIGLIFFFKYIGICICFCFNANNRDPNSRINSFSADYMFSLRQSSIAWIKYVRCSSEICELRFLNWETRCENLFYFIPKSSGFQWEFILYFVKNIKHLVCSSLIFNSLKSEVLLTNLWLCLYGNKPKISSFLRTMIKISLHISFISLL